MHITANTASMSMDFGRCIWGGIFNYNNNITTFASASMGLYARNDNVINSSNITIDEAFICGVSFGLTEAFNFYLYYGVNTIITTKANKHMKNILPHRICNLILIFSFINEQKYEKNVFEPFNLLFEFESSVVFFFCSIF